MKKWYPCELHCHTVHSDGDFTVEGLIETAKERGLKGICLTDHNTYSGREEAAKEKELVILQGIEWTTYFGHMLVLGANCFVEWRDAVSENIDIKMKQVHAAGGLVGIAHPFQLGTPICTGGRWDFKVQDFSLVNYMEIWSEGEPLMNTANRSARKMWHEKLSEGFRIAPTMGRDWHRAERNIRKGACTYLLCDGELTDMKMKEAVKCGRSVISMGPLFYFTIGDKTMGDEVTAGEQTLEFTLDFKRMAKMGVPEKVAPEKIKIISVGGQEVKTLDPTCLRTEITLKENTWYNAELRGKIDNDENCLIALTAPVYVKGE